MEVADVVGILSNQLNQSFERQEAIAEAEHLREVWSIDVLMNESLNLLVRVSLIF